MSFVLGLFTFMCINISLQCLQKLCMAATFTWSKGGVSVSDLIQLFLSPWELCHPYLTPLSFLLSLSLKEFILTKYYKCNQLSLEQKEKHILVGNTEADLHCTLSVMVGGGCYMWLGITNEFMHLFNTVKYFKEQELMYKCKKKERVPSQWWSCKKRWT